MKNMVVYLKIIYFKKYLFVLEILHMLLNSIFIFQDEKIYAGLLSIRIILDNHDKITVLNKVSEEKFYNFIDYRRDYRFVKKD